VTGWGTPRRHHADGSPLATRRRPDRGNSATDRTTVR
jgi:hypothetical protein